jgi:hypothetical protein
LPISAYKIHQHDLQNHWLVTTLNDKHGMEEDNIAPPVLEVHWEVHGHSRRLLAEAQLLIGSPGVVCNCPQVR